MLTKSLGNLYESEQVSEKLFWFGGLNFAYWFLLFWLCWAFVAALGLLSVAEQELWSTQASVLVVCGLRCPEACGISVPWSGIKPASPALHGGSLTTEPPGKPLIGLFWTMESFLNQHLSPKLDLRNSEKRASLFEENHGALSPAGCPHLRQLTDPPPQESNSRGSAHSLSFKQSL